MNASEEAEEIKTFPLYPYQLQRQQALPIELQANISWTPR